MRNTSRTDGPSHRPDRRAIRSARVALATSGRPVGSARQRHPSPLSATITRHWHIRRLCSRLTVRQAGLSKGVVKTYFFSVFWPKQKKLKSPNFRVLKVFLEKKLKIQILDSQSQQKIVAFQSISCVNSYAIVAHDHKWCGRGMGVSCCMRYSS